MLQVPSPKPFFRVHVDRLFRAQAQLRTLAISSVGNALSRITVIYETTQDTGSKAITVCKQSILALQIIVLFLLMPQHYVGQFYQLVQVAMGLSSVDSPKAYLGSLNRMKKKLHNFVAREKSSSLQYLVGTDDDMPGMVKSSSVLSIADMDHFRNGEGMNAV